MNDRQRLADLKDNLDILYEKLGSFQRELNISASEPIKFELKQRIKREILPNIRRYEAEYWALYPQEAIRVSEEEAKVQLVEIERAVETLKPIQSIEYPPELIQLLYEILDKLEDSNKAAAAKLKVTLPLLPMIASYELEMDTEGMVYRTWNSLKRLVRR